MCRFSKLLLFSFFFCKDGSDRLMKRASYSCCNFFCVVLAAAYLKYRRCRLSCLPFVWHFFSLWHTHTQTHANTRMHAHPRTHTCTLLQTETHTHIQIYPLLLLRYIVPRSSLNHSTTSPKGHIQKLPKARLGLHFPKSSHEGHALWQTLHNHHYLVTWNVQVVNFSCSESPLSGWSRTTSISLRW